MVREERFNLRLSADERAKLRRLAVHFRRSESGAIRWLIHEAAERLDAAQATATRQAEDGRFGAV